MKKLPKPPGLDVSQLPEGHWEKDTQKSKLLIEARVLFEKGNEESAIDMYATAASLEEELMQECKAVSLWIKFFSHAFSAIHCWARAGNFYRARQICQMVLQHPELSEPQRQNAIEVLTALRDGVRVYNLRKAA
ncbi:MAG: hypothetical protein QM758_15735 [Armatimonas sp.]